MFFSNALIMLNLRTCKQIERLNIQFRDARTRCLHCTNSKYLDPVKSSCEDMCPDGYFPGGTGLLAAVLWMVLLRCNGNHQETPLLYSYKYVVCVGINSHGQATWHLGSWPNLTNSRPGCRYIKSNLHSMFRRLRSLPFT